MITLSDILIIVVAYCPEDDILLHCQIKESQYLIVDNSPKSDKALEKNCERMKNCHYLAMNDNIGIAKAFNIGCEYAISKGYAWALTMDQDSQMSRDVLEKMLAFINRFEHVNQTAIFSPRHVLQNYKKVKLQDETQEYQEGFGPMSSGNMVNLKIWQEISGFDNALFIDMVDVDYYCKAMVHGYKVITVNQVEMPHKLGNLETKKFFTKKIPVMHHSAVRKYYQTRNVLILLKRYKIFSKNAKIMIGFLLLMVVTTLLWEKQKFQKIKSMWLGLYDFLTGKIGRYEDIRGIREK